MKEITVQVCIGDRVIWKTFMTDFILKMKSPVHIFGDELNKVLKIASQEEVTK